MVLDVIRAVSHQRPQLQSLADPSAMTATALDTVHCNARAQSSSVARLGTLGAETQTESKLFVGCRHGQTRTRDEQATAFDIDPGAGRRSPRIQSVVVVTAWVVSALVSVADDESAIPPAYEGQRGLFWKRSYRRRDLEACGEDVGSLRGLASKRHAREGCRSGQDLGGEAINPVAWLTRRSWRQGARRKCWPRVDCVGLFSLAYRG